MTRGPSGGGGRRALRIGAALIVVGLLGAALFGLLAITVWALSTDITEGAKPGPNQWVIPFAIAIGFFVTAFVGWRLIRRSG